MDNNDHDLLIEIKTTVKNLAEGQTNFMKELRDLNIRVASLEAKDQRDSEKVFAITKDVQESINNSKRISEAFIEIGGIKEDISELKKKSNLLDTINAIGVMISGVIGFIFGNK